MRIARYVRQLEAYTPGEQPKGGKVVKLNTNENPYPPTPKCHTVFASFDLDRLRRYPDPEFGELRAVLAKLNGAQPENIFIGNGSDEVLALAAKCFVENDESIASRDPSYSLYKTLAAIRDVRWVGVDNPFTAAGRAALRAARTSLYLLTNPNAPTGEFRAPTEIAAFARLFKGVVIVDEAYADFACANCLSYATAADNRNLLVLRTFSKSYSLAGLRVGYCVGPADLIGAMYKVKDSYNVDAVAQAIALVAAKDQKWMKANVKKVITTRGWFMRELAARGWDVPPSESNFCFVRPPADGPDAAATFAALKARNIFVRYFRGPKTGDRLRITIGTDAEMKTLLRALDKIHQSSR